MRQIRKFTRTTRVIFSLFASIVVITFSVMGVTAVQTAAAKAPGIALEAGTVIYDSTCTPIQLTDSAMVIRESGTYYLGQDNGRIPLGQHTLAYDGSGVRVFGGGYRIDADGSVHTVSDEDVFNDINSGAVFKLADRRYAMAYSTITDSSNVFSTDGYLYISMDMVGNARLYSNNMSLKTTQPTTIVTTPFLFDIANEILQLGSQNLNLGRLIGTTNTYDSGIYKAIDEPQTPDSIDLTIRGGAGGSGGAGGTGGTGGIGGIGGIGGTGGDGGRGGDGGEGGDGGRGGDGGNGGIGEDQDVVQIIMLKSVKSETSTSLKADYYFVDPFGTLGMVYLELHKASLMPSGATMQSLYENESAEIENYWEGNSYRRVSVSPYDNSYTFTGLEPGAVYYVAMGHVGENIDTGEIERTLDDYYKVSTRNPSNSLTISTVNQSSVGFTLNLESMDMAAAKVEIEDYPQYNVSLGSNDIGTAISSGYRNSISVNANHLKTLSSISIVVRDAQGNVLLRARCNNSFYEPGSGSGSGT